ncbi:hypothetical protein [Streptomyces tsukubensis]|uniref:Uncharacterized protein n=1 Tax=Streptomyces tsukubensis TaxID=83656 RepID=A0A1V4A4U0_9ACTN|nr:hypothetical protein [Streptomyces tsukubensis]OON74943.1 hypothetical protein B1H18_24325 [Streptomyces tsukubensis]
MTSPLIAPLTSSPFWQLLRLRLGAQENRALVFLAANGVDGMVPPRGDDYWGYPRPTMRTVRQQDFLDIVWVSLAERRISVDIPRRPPKHPARYGVAWRISNPVDAARNQLTEERARHLVAGHISDSATLPGAADPLRRPPPHFGTTEVEPPGRPRVIDGFGLTYWFLDPPAAFLPTPGAGVEPALPSGFGEAHREAYRFYREVVAGGPVGLAALWLLNQPEQAKDVLEWTVTHRTLLGGEASWEHTLAATLQSLTPEDRGFVGVNLARVLSDIGVAQGDEIMHRLHHPEGAEGWNGSYEEPR